MSGGWGAWMPGFSPALGGGGEVGQVGKSRVQLGPQALLGSTELAMGWLGGRGPWLLFQLQEEWGKVLWLRLGGGGGGWVPGHLGSVVVLPSSPGQGVMGPSPIPDGHPWLQWGSPGSWGSP